MNLYSKRKKALDNLEKQLTKIRYSKALTEYYNLFPQHSRLIDDLVDLIDQIRAIRKVDLAIE